MKKYISGIIAIGLITGLSACSDQFNEIQADEVLPATETLAPLDCWGYSVPFEIQGEGEWRIENDCRFISVSPEAGRGKATLEIFTRDNDSAERRTGSFRIVFPKNPAKSRTVEVTQKGTAEYDESETRAVQGAKQWAVGYGYNLSAGYASPTALKAAILDHSKLGDRISYGASSMEIETSSYTGSSITELSNDLNASAGFKGGAWGFTGEIKASFDYKTFNSSTHEYILNYHTIVTSPVYLEGMNRSTIARGRYMWTDAYNAINGLDPYYPSTPEGFKRLLEDYGTHIVISAGLGGRVRHSTTVDISQITDAYDLDAYAAASYKGIVEAGASVSDQFHQSFQDNKKHCKSKLSVSGGTEATQLELQGSGGFTEANLKAWQKTVSSRPALVSLNAEEDMLPLYEIVDINNYPERGEALKAFMTGQAIQEVYKPISMEYNTGTVTRFEVPTFDGSKQQNSLIKDIYAGGQLVAKACEEYIPVINMFRRVTVIYPVISNKTRWNMGYFIGDADHKPARVCWEGRRLTVSEYTDESKGTKTELYARGSTFSTSTSDDIAQGKVVGHTVAAPGHDGKSHDYPVVKIFNQIWMRDNFQSRYPANGQNPTSDTFYVADGSNEHCMYDGYYEYWHTIIDGFAPDKWRIPEQMDFQTIVETLTANKVTHLSPGKAFFPDDKGGVLGFHHRFNGYCAYKVYYQDAGTDGMYGCINATQSVGLVVTISSNETIQTSSNWTWQGSKRFSIRFVQDIE